MPRSSDTATQTTVAVGAASTLILAASGNRQALILQNDADEAMYFSLGKAAVAGEGIRLDEAAATFGQAGTIKLEGPSCYRGAVYGICASGSKDVLVTEIRTDEI